MILAMHDTVNSVALVLARCTVARALFARFCSGFRKAAASAISAVKALC